MPLANGNTPPRPGLSESARANMEAFLDYLFMVLPAVRIDMFVQNVRPAAPAEPSATSPTPGVRFTLDYPSQSLKAVALLEDGEFIVQAGSQARAAWEGQEKATSAYASLHDDLK